MFEDRPAYTPDGAALAEEALADELRSVVRQYDFGADRELEPHFVEAGDSAGGPPAAGTSIVKQG